MFNAIFWTLKNDIYCTLCVWWYIFWLVIERLCPSVLLTSLCMHCGWPGLQTNCWIKSCCAWLYICIHVTTCITYSFLIRQKFNGLLAKFGLLNSSWPVTVFCSPQGCLTGVEGLRRIYASPGKLKLIFTSGLNEFKILLLDKAIQYIRQYWLSMVKIAMNES